MPRESPDPLIAAIDRLTGEVASLRDVIEEFRVCFEWAVNNDRLRCGAEECEWRPRRQREPCEGAREADDARPLVEDLREKVAGLTSIVEEMRRVPGSVAPKEQRSLFQADDEAVRGA